jgi:site-specific recombinase
MLEFLAYLLGGTAIFEAGLLIWAVIIISGYRGYSSEYMRLVGKIRAETMINAELERRSRRVVCG